MPPGDHSGAPGSKSPGDLSLADKKELLKRYPSVTAVVNGVAAAVTYVTIQPFAVMRTMVQSMNIYGHGIDANRSKIWGILQTFRAGGIRTMYRGCTSSVFISFSGWLIFRFIYDKLAMYEFYRDRDKTSVNMARSATSSLITSVVLHPFWNARIAIELQSGQTSLDKWPQYRGTLNYIVTTLQRPGGLRAVFRGLAVSVSGVSHHTLLMAIYEKLSALKWHARLKRVEKFKPFVNGMVSRMVPTLVCYPLYVSRVMQQCHNTEVTRLSIARILRWNFSRNSIRGMYSGLPVQLVRSVLSGGIMFTVYEGLLSLTSGVLYGFLI